jgi:hypothetical protein
VYEYKDLKKSIHGSCNTFSFGTYKEMCQGEYEHTFRLKISFLNECDSGVVKLISVGN